MTVEGTYTKSLLPNLRINPLPVLRRKLPFYENSKGAREGEVKGAIKTLAVIVVSIDTFLLANLLSLLKTDSDYGPPLPGIVSKGDRGAKREFSSLVSTSTRNVSSKTYV